MLIVNSQQERITFDLYLQTRLNRIFTPLCNSSPETPQVIVALTVTAVIHLISLVTHSSPESLYLAENVWYRRLIHSSPLVNVFRVTSKISLYIAQYQINTSARVMSGWRVTKMNHRYNSLIDKPLQRYGWRVAELF